MTQTSLQAEPPMLRELFIRLVEDEFRRAFEQAAVDLTGVGRLARLTQLSDVGTFGVQQYAGPFDPKSAAVIPLRVAMRTPTEARLIAEALARDAIDWIERAQGRVEMADTPRVAVLPRLTGDDVCWISNARTQSLTAPV